MLLFMARRKCKEKSECKRARVLNKNNNTFLSFLLKALFRNFYILSKDSVEKILLVASLAPASQDCLMHFFPSCVLKWTLIWKVFTSSVTIFSLTHLPRDPLFIDASGQHTSHSLLSNKIIAQHFHYLTLLHSHLFLCLIKKSPVPPPFPVPRAVLPPPSTL